MVPDQIMGDTLPIIDYYYINLSDTRNIHVIIKCMIVCINSV